MKPLIPMRASLGDPAIFGDILPGESWAAWRILLVAMVGEELYPEERAIFAKLTERASEPLQFVEEFVGIIGRRGGKSRAASVLARIMQRRLADVA